MSSAISYKPQVNGNDLRPIYANEEGKILFYGRIMWDEGCLADCYRITLNETYDEEGISIQINSGTQFCLSDSHRGACDVYVLVKVKSDMCIAELVCHSDIFSATDEIDRPTKLTLLEWMLTLDKTQRMDLLTQSKGPSFEKRNSTAVKITGIQNLTKKYQLIKNTFTPQQQSDIESMFEQYNSKAVSGTVKQKAELRLQNILNISTTTTKKINLTKSEIIRKLSRHLDKMDTVKEEIAEAIIASKYSIEKGMIIALVGNPGVGKTCIGKALAEVLGIPFTRISIGSSSTLLDQIGLASVYDGSDCGEVARSFYKFGTTNVVLLLDELDKAVSSKDGNPQNAFTDMLSDDHIFKDAFLGTYINTQDTCIVLTMNSTENVPEHLLNRCTVINVPDYSVEEKAGIIKRHILPKALSRYNISTELIDFPDDSIHYLLENYTSDSGARESKRFTEKIIRSILSEWDERGEQTKIRITPHLIDSILENYVNRDVSVCHDFRKIGF